MEGINSVSQVTNSNNSETQITNGVIEKSDQMSDECKAPDVVPTSKTASTPIAVVNGTSCDNATEGSTKSETKKVLSEASIGAKQPLPSNTDPSQIIQQSAVPRASSVSTLSNPNEAPPKNRSSREEKTRKKDDKSVDHVLRALNSLNTTEEKLAAMCKKYADLFDEHRKLQLLHKQTEKKTSQLQREKEVLQADHSKAILTRSRLENLCRELQRQNKAIKDESLLKIREEEEKRKEVSAKFQATMNEITTLMQQNNDNNMKLRDDNIDMTAKLKSICEQYDARQQQVERISHQMQLEQQLADAKLKKLKMEMDSDRAELLDEKQQLLMELHECKQRCNQFQETELNLRGQISMYNEKYDEFQKALARSNEVFGGFKDEMERMSKKILKLEKETMSWKQRWERSHQALLDMSAEKQRSTQDLTVVSRQLTTLQSLCRTLQAERTAMMAKLRDLQAGSQDSSGTEQCLKQCLEQPASHSDQPAKNDPVLVQYNQDLLASFKESVLDDDKDSPLPDVVGEAATSMADSTPYLCDRLDDLSLQLSALVAGGETPVVNGITPAVTEPTVPSSQEKLTPVTAATTSPSKKCSNEKKSKESAKKKKK